MTRRADTPTALAPANGSGPASKDEGDDDAPEHGEVELTPEDLAALERDEALRLHQDDARRKASLAREEVDAWDRLAREQGTASRFWVRRDRDPDDPRPMQIGIYPYPITGKISGAAVAEKIGGGGLIRTTTTDPYGPVPPQWSAPNKLLGNPKSDSLEPVTTDGRPVSLGPVAGGTDPEKDLQRVFSSKENQYVWKTRVQIEREEADAIEAAREKRAKDQAMEGLAGVRADLELNQREFMKEVLGELKALHEKVALPAAPVGRHPAEAYLDKMMEAEKLRAAADLAKAEAGKEVASNDLALKMRELELKYEQLAHAPAPAALQSSDPMRQFDSFLALYEKLERRAGGGVKEDLATPSLLREIWSDVRTAVSLGYGNPDAPREAGGPFRRYVEMAIDRAHELPRKQVVVKQVQKENPASGEIGAPAETGAPSEQEKKQAYEQMALDLSVFVTTLDEVVAGKASPEDGWKNVVANVSPGFVEEMKKRKSLSDLVTTLKDLAAMKEMGQYAKELHELARVCLGAGRPRVERFIEASKA